jgi:hypothetical protein
VTSAAFQGLGAAVAGACGLTEAPQPSGEVDWPEFLRLVGRHRVAPLVQRSDWLAQAAAPPEVRTEVDERARFGALRSLRLLALQREVLDVLADAGVDVVVLKGTTVASDAHGDPTVRAPGDIDLLVGPDSVPRAVHALRSAGLEWFGWRTPEDPDRPPPEPGAIERAPRLPMLRDVTLVRDGLQVEVHWRLFANSRLLPVDPGWLSHPRHMEMQGGNVPSLPLSAQWLYVLVHGSNHLWSLMKWLADVPALAVRHPEVARPDALAAAGAGHRRSLATGLLAAEATFGRFLTPESREWAARGGGTRLLVQRSLRALTADEDLPKRVTPRAMPETVVGRLALRRDARYRIEEMRLLLLSAGRAQGVEDPGPLEMAAGPLRWARRVARRAGARARAARSGRGRALRRLAGASWRDRALVAEAAVCLALARLAVLVLPFRAIAAGLGRPMEESDLTDSPADVELGRRIAWALGAVSARAWWRTKCLEQALAGGAMLRLRRVPNTLYLGVARAADGESPLDAHAWLRTGTLHVTGGARCERYAVLSTFAYKPDRPAACASKNRR